MKRFFSILSVVALVVSAVACDPDTPEEVVKDVELSTPELIEAGLTSADFKVSVACADEAAYKVVAGDATLTAEEVLEGGVALTFDAKASYTEAQEVALAVAELEENTSYTLWVAAANAKSSKATSLAFSTLADEENPEPEPEPAGPEVELSAITLLDVQGTTAEFTVTVRNMNNFYYYVAASTEGELTAADVKEKGTWAWIEDNTSWDADFDVPFNASGLVPDREYVVYAVAANDTSEKMSYLAFSTIVETDIVKTITFNPTEASVSYKDGDKTNHYLTFSNSSYSMTVHLKNDTLAGWYESANGDNAIFLAEGSSFTDLSSGKVYEPLDETFGKIDIYENTITGNHEIYANVLYMPNISIELTYYGVVEGATRKDPYEESINVLWAEAYRSESDDKVWNLTLRQDKNNTVTLALHTVRALDYIPSGTYEVLASGESSGSKHIIADQSTMCVNNVRTALGERSVGVSSLTVEYDATTKQTWVEATLYVESGTTVVKIAKVGPFELYAVDEPEQEVTTEKNNLMIWATWYGEGQYWELDWSGDNYYGILNFVTGENSRSHLPAGRYYLSTTAPADGSYWVDCNTSYICKMRSSEQMKIVAEEGSYFDVTAEQGDGWEHNITGVIKTTNGLHVVNFNYTTARGSIY